jgi:hypothetical protein
MWDTHLLQGVEGKFLKMNRSTPRLAFGKQRHTTLRMLSAISGLSLYPFAKPQ